MAVDAGPLLWSVCGVEMKRVAVINVVGLTRGLVGGRAPRLAAFFEEGGVRGVRPVLPAVTCSAQATYLTGLAPSEHGIVGNGWYDRELAEHHFWKQSNHLVGGEKIWEVLKARHGDGFTCAKLFWWYNMYSSADWTITPRPMYPADGKKVFDVYTQPMGMREEVKADLGDFPFPAFWGPGAGIGSSRWIAASAKWVEEKKSPTLSLVYLPHLDYDLQRFGSAGEGKALGEIDGLFGELLDFYTKRGVEVVVVSEYGITDVDRPVALNREFRKRGWFTVKDELGLEMADLGASKVFAIADHQVAHVHVNDVSLLGEVKAMLEGVDGVEQVLDGEGKREAGVDHARSGELVVVADSRSWFSYYYWLDDAVAPDFARCVDIHRKIGYDPAELFLDPSLCCPKLKVGWSLVKKKLGMRMLMDVIPLDASLVAGSHGRVPEDEGDWPVLAGAGGGEVLEATGVFGELLKLWE